MDREKNGWVRIASNSRAGRFYLFNKATGETQWLPSKQDDPSKGEKQQPPLKFSSIGKVGKTPAQDRLKRLQHSLKVNQTKSHIANAEPKIVCEQENKIDDTPSTSSSSKFVGKSLKKTTRISHYENNDLVKCAKSAVEETHIKLPISHSTFNNCKTSGNRCFSADASREDSNTPKQLVTNDYLQNMETNGSKLTNIRSVIVNKIKEIFKLPFNLSKKNADEKSRNKKTDDNSFGLINNSKLKTSSKTKSKQILSSSVAQEKIISKIKEDIKKSPENEIFTRLIPKTTSRDQPVSSYPKGSANARLERLQQSLHSQQQSNSTKYGSDTSKAIETNSNAPSTFQKTNKLNCNTAEKTRKDEVEAMDWQPILKEETLSDATTISPPLVVEKSKKCPIKSVTDYKNVTMGDIIDTVNENLLRFSAEKQKHPNNISRKWRKDFYYFVVDTNVLLRDLAFIEDLSKMKLCDTNGSLLYIPYSVLQELDKLKMRSGAQEGVKTLAVRAIKYLNTKLENYSIHVQAQSAIEERHHLIDVNSADDSIINCCLQAKKHIPNLLFLTEDVNLRNKAICNNIIVSAKSDLVAKRHDSSNIS